MRAVWKFPIPIQDYFSLSLPEGAQLLDVQVQRGEPQLWALCNVDAPTLETRRFRLAGTGHLIDGAAPLGHVGTFQIEHLGLVFHLFELGRGL